MPDTLSGEVLAIALQKFGWQSRTAAPGRYDVWTPRDGQGEEELVVPIDPARGDYEVLVSRALDELVKMYGRQAQSLIGLLRLSRQTRLEETEWKKESKIEGMIPWEMGESLYASARSQLSAAARSTRERRRRHGSASSYLAQKFLGDSYMGQTDIGSFVITAYTPSDQRFFLTQHSENISGEGSPRNVETVAGSTILDTFETALSAVREALDEYRRRPKVELFLDAVEEGLSYELAAALGDFSRGGDSGIKISRRLLSSETFRVREFGFDPIDAPVLDRVATALVQDPEPIPATIIGEVTDLSRKRKEGSRDRVIRIDVKSGAKSTSVRVRLTAEQYEQAMAVHRDEQWLKVRGVIERDGRYSWIYRPEAIEAEERPVIEQDDPLELEDERTRD